MKIGQVRIAETVSAQNVVYANNNYSFSVFLCQCHLAKTTLSVKKKTLPAVLAVHSQSLPSVADVLLQRQRTSTCSSSSSTTVRAPTTILELGCLHSGLSKIHLIKLDDTCLQHFRKKREQICARCSAQGTRRRTITSHLLPHKMLLSSNWTCFLSSWDNHDLDD